ncbi:MerR family transcriptional regulator [Alistipes shahii]|uniref:MerR family transcriptional regulator n=2 Tax=Alistipes TaxID=239759 RepID=UPI003AAAE4B2
MADKLFYSMGEVAEMFDVNTSLIRHWESQFSILRPKRNKKGNRLFSPEDVENLKMIYHLVKERGMTLEGAKKALRKAPSESGVDRDAELMERLQRIRALLVEVREDLKAGEGEIVTASDADMTDADAAADAAAADAAADAAAADAAAETPVRRRRAKAVVKIDEPSDDAAGKAAGKAAGDSSAQPAVKRSVRRPRRKKEEAETKELFAFYEQSLF